MSYGTFTAINCYIQYSFKNLKGLITLIMHVLWVLMLLLNSFLLNTFYYSNQWSDYMHFLLQLLKLYICLPRLLLSNSSFINTYYYSVKWLYSSGSEWSVLLLEWQEHHALKLSVLSGITVMGKYSENVTLIGKYYQNVLVNTLSVLLLSLV